MCCLKKYFKILTLSCIVFSFIGCERNELIPDKQSEKGEGYTKETIVANRLKVKFSPSLGENFTEIKNSVATKGDSNTVADDILEKMGASKMRRLFAYNEEYDKLMRKYGLHLWYVVEFDEKNSVTKADGIDIKSIKAIDGIDIVENVVRPICNVKQSDAKFWNASGPAPMSNYVMKDGVNDPMYSQQWNLRNRGNIAGSVAGADINMEMAWAVETGDPKVIVAVLDGGIDYTHPDLKDNVYTVTKDYGDGFKDQGQHGYNFCKKILSYYDAIDAYGNPTKKAIRDSVLDEVALTPHFHGTHVAGIIGAKNNNNEGICGIAGGNGEAGSGVRLLSCQIMDDWGGTDYYENAFVYAQIRGAVIAQCSWGWPMNMGYDWESFTTIFGNKSMSLRDAIDYFINCAGCGPDEKQRADSPMKGGLVVFAAGNEPFEFESFPAIYDGVIAVSAMAPNFKRSPFTTYGKWVDIMAPGGNGADGVTDPGNVLSTYPVKTGRNYAFLPGTSMACPHVSGVAALVVSKYGGPGYTVDSLKRQVLSAIKPYDLYKYNSEPQYQGKLGLGYIDAYRALSVNENMPPAKVGDMKINPLYKEVEFTWTPVYDADDKTADFYDLYYSTTKLDESNYTTGNHKALFVGELKQGQKFNYLLEGLELDTQYYFAVVSRDRWGLKSAPSFGNAKTRQNNVPVLRLEKNDVIKLIVGESAQNTVYVNEPDGQDWTYTVDKPRFVNAVLAKDKSGIIINISSNGSVGKYSVKVTVKDAYGLESTINVDFEICENNPPKLIAPIEKIFISENNSLGYELDLSEYIKDEDGHKIEFSCESKDYNVCIPALSDSRLFVTPVATGLTMITITAEDSHGAKMKKNVQVQVVEDKLVYIAYPVPVTTTLNVRLNDRLSSAVIKIRNVNGSVFLTRNVDIAEEADRMVELDLSRYTPGTYVLDVVSGSEKYSQTFIKR